MVQILKETVRGRIAEAARAQFAQVGFLRATMGAIAREAGVASGTIYKYYSGKDVLFASVVTDGFVEEFRRLTRSRIAGFARPGGLDAHGARGGEPGDLLRFFLRHRQEVVILLARAEGTPYASFCGDYVRDMEAQALRQAREQFPDMEQTRTFRFMVRAILEESVRGLVAILEAFEEEESIREALDALTAYQLAGIKALVAWNGGKGVDDARV